MAINKVIYGNQTLIDLTADTVDASHLLSGYTAHDKSGELIEGTNTFDSDTQDATAIASEIITGKTAYARGVKLTGTMPNRGGVVGSISTKTQEYSISSGYHDGSGKVSIDSVEQAKIISSNIKAGVEILGVVGDYSGESITVQTKTVTPYTTAQTILPDDGYDYLAQVTVNKISYVETPNSAGGTTVKIGDVAS